MSTRRTIKKLSFRSTSDIKDPLSSVKDATGQTTLLTSEQISLLNTLGFNKESLYYIVESIRRNGFDSTYDQLNDSIGSDRDRILTLSEFDPARHQLYLDNQIFKLKIESTKGTFGKCRRCSGDEVYYAEKQTRSPDEPMSIFITCSNCSYSWIS